MLDVAFLIYSILISYDMSLNTIMWQFFSFFFYLRTSPAFNLNVRFLLNLIFLWLNCFLQSCNFFLAYLHDDDDDDDDEQVEKYCCILGDEIS